MQDKLSNRNYVNNCTICKLIKCKISYFTKKNVIVVLLLNMYIMVICYCTLIEIYKNK